MRRALPLLVAAASVLAFLPALRNGFVALDGNDNFVFNANYAGVHWWHWGWIFGSSFYAGNYEPLHWLGLSAVYRLFGMAPWAYHLEGLLLHSCACFLLYQACLELGFEAEASAIAAVLFGVHPLRAEAVSWVMGQHYPLAAIFCLLSLIGYLRGRRALSIAAYAASLLALPAAAGFPLVLLVLDEWVLRKRDFKGKLPYFALALADGVVMLASRRLSHQLVPLSSLGITARVLLAAHGAAFYLVKTVLPLGLSPVYELGAPYSAERWLSGFLILGISSSLFILRTRWPRLWAAWLCYLLALLPVSGLGTSGAQAAADRYSYFPALVLSLSLAPVLSSLPITKSALPIFALALAGRSWGYCTTWKDPDAVWARVLAVDPESGTGHVGLGYSLLGRRDFDGARSEFEQAIRFNPALVAPYYALGYLEANSGHPQQAIAYFRETARRDPSFAPAYNAIGAVLAQSGHAAEAVPFFEKTLALRPDNDRARANFAYCLEMLGRKEEALTQYRRALELNPDLDKTGPR